MPGHDPNAKINSGRAKEQVCIIQCGAPCKEMTRIQNLKLAKFGVHLGNHRRSFGEFLSSL